MSAKDQLIERTLTIVNANLSVLDVFFAQHHDRLQWQRPKASTITLVELLSDVPVDQFAHQLVKEQGIMILPASQFDMTGNYFRLGFGRRNLPEVLEHFEDYLRQAMP